MDGRVESIYNPTGSWGDLNALAEKPDGGIGKTPEKNPTPTLRVFGSNLGNQWLMYGGITGGTQDYTPSPHGSNTPAKCEWFRFFYTGIMDIKGEGVFGHWKITVEGSGLDQVAYEVGKHVKPTLFVGDKTTGLQSVSVKAVRIELAKLKQQKGMEEREEWEG